MGMDGLLKVGRLGAIGFRFEVGLGKMDKRSLRSGVDSSGKMI